MKRKKHQSLEKSRRVSLALAIQYLALSPLGPRKALLQVSEIYEPPFRSSNSCTCIPHTAYNTRWNRSSGSRVPEQSFSPDDQVERQVQLVFTQSELPDLGGRGTSVSVSLCAWFPKTFERCASKLSTGGRWCWCPSELDEESQLAPLILRCGVDYALRKLARGESPS